MTKHERLAVINIKNCFNYEIGGLFNAWMDGAEIEYPSIEEEKEEIYRLAMKNLYSAGECVIGGAPREMRFAGKAYCKRYIDHLFEKCKNDSDMINIPWKEN